MGTDIGRIAAKWAVDLIRKSVARERHMLRSVGGHTLGLSLRSGAGADGYMVEMFVVPLGNQRVNGKGEPQAVLSGETSLLDASYQARFRAVSLDLKPASPWSSAEEQLCRSADCCVSLLCMSSVRL